jgi:hypothetical protein
MHEHQEEELHRINCSDIFVPREECLLVCHSYFCSLLFSTIMIKLSMSQVPQADGFGILVSKVSFSSVIMGF